VEANVDEPGVSRWRALDEIQQRLAEWQRRQFPDANEADLALGVCEEAGELAACVLKRKRRIRLEEYTNERLQDAIADVVVFAMAVCDANGWRLSDVLETAAVEVLGRNWRQS
jgi:NTP pyrophosphatase (non-canonical NTP hydrolase)